MEDDDPFEMVAVGLPFEGEEHVKIMAETFIEEYVRMGWTDVMLLVLFKMPIYRGPYAAYLALGEEKIKKMIDETMLRLKLGGA